MVTSRISQHTSDLRVSRSVGLHLVDAEAVSEMVQMPFSESSLVRPLRQLPCRLSDLVLIFALLRNAQRPRSKRQAFSVCRRHMAMKHFFRNTSGSFFLITGCSICFWGIGLGFLVVV